MINYDCHNNGFTERSAALKEYYGRYLREIRGLSESSVRHYYDALNNISRRLVAKQLVNRDIYEITNTEYLMNVREILFADPEFVQLNERGNSMYSAGLNNYLRFASGDDFLQCSDYIEKMDIPVKPEDPIIIEHTVWRRSDVLRNQVLAGADYKCEINGAHETFIAEKTKKPYMESHHAIPMRLQPRFENSLDIYANIVCLCPICHRRVHYGLQDEKNVLIQRIYHNRADRLARSGIKLSQQEFIEFAGKAEL